MQVKEIRNMDLPSLLEKARIKFLVPGISVVLFNQDEVLNHVVSGSGKMGGERAISRSNYFHIGSTSKSILAVLAGKQVELGNIRWDTKYFDLFTDLRELASSSYYQITLEDLFLCRAGIQPYVDGSEKYPELIGDHDVKKLDFARYLFSRTPSSKKEHDGKYAFLYSNAGYTLAAMMLEKASGKTYEWLLSEFLETYLNVAFIFGWPNNYDSSEPWGHGNFDFTSDNQEFKLDKHSLKSFEPGHFYKLNELIRPAGDISMKPLHFAIYTQLFLKGIRGINSYITSATFRHISLSKRGFAYGIANARSMGKQIVGFDGSASTFYCRGIMVPEDNIGFTIMINSGSQAAVDWLSKKIARKYYNWWWKFWL